MASLINLDLNERILIPQDQFYIGRGPTLKVTDKRVSRNHAVIKYENGRVFVKPIHKNPTFVTRDSKQLTLAKDIWEELFDGDTISLLPTSLSFKVCIEEKIQETQNYELQESPSCDNEEKEGKVEHAAQNGIKNDTNNYEAPPSQLKRKRKLPSWMIDLEDTGNVTTKKTKAAKKPPKRTPIKLKVSAESNAVVENKEVKENRTPKNPSLPPSKTSYQDGVSNSSIVSRDMSIVQNSADDIEAVENKTKNDDKQDTDVTFKDDEDTPINADSLAEDSEDPSDRLSLNDGKPTQNTGKNIARNSKSSISQTSDSNIKGNSSAKLLACPYGKSCYRKNPIHFTEYSHSASENEDENVGSDDDLPECEYGSSCYRKNPQHFKEYKHTKNTATKTKTRRRKKDEKTKKPSVLDDDSDDDGEPNTYDYNDSFIKDDGTSEEETFNFTDDSEDSDYVPESAEGEDINELLEEADDFVRNKKMQK